MDLDHIPAYPPPPGETSNFKNPVSLAKPLVIVNVVFLSLMVIFVVLRIYTKGFIARKLWWDDYTCILAAAISIAHTGTVLGSLKYGFGVHLWDIPISKLTMQAAHMLNAVSLIYGPAMFFIKISILLLYFRIFKVNKTMRLMIHIGIYTQIAFYLAYVATNAAVSAVCVSIDALSNPLCLSIWIIVDVQGAITVVTDFYILALPTVMVSQLQLTFRRKLGVIAIFMTGLVACIVSVVRLVLASRLAHSPDFFWNAASTSVLSAIELNTGIISGSMTSLPIFFRRHPISFNLSYFKSRILGPGSSLNNLSIWKKHVPIGSFHGISLHLPKSTFADLDSSAKSEPNSTKHDSSVTQQDTQYYSGGNQSQSRV